MDLRFIDIFEVIFLGFIRGITEWLPISYTGHMLLVSEFITFKISEELIIIFVSVIHLGALMAVVVVYIKKIFPFLFDDEEQYIIKKETLSLWFKVILACIASFPMTVIGILFDNYIQKHLFKPVVAAAALILFGIAFIAIETWNKKRVPVILKTEDITYKTALLIGLFQVLTLIPGTSSSATTIIGLMLIGVSGAAATEFMFLLSIPTIFNQTTARIPPPL